MSYSLNAWGLVKETVLQLSASEKNILGRIRGGWYGKHYIIILKGVSKIQNMYLDAQYRIAHRLQATR